MATGGHGGILGGIGFGGAAAIKYLPATRHTHRSDVNISRLPGKKVLVTSDMHAYRSVRAFRKAGGSGSMWRT